MNRRAAKRYQKRMLAISCLDRPLTMREKRKLQEANIRWFRWAYGFRGHMRSRKVLSRLHKAIKAYTKMVAEQKSITASSILTEK